MSVPKVAVMNDISGFGRCSLTAAIPVLSVCGVQAVPLPTAVLSNQTCFASYEKLDCSKYLPRLLNGWKKLHPSFDGIFTGYLAGAEQVDLAKELISDFRGENTLIFVDPVLGDEGKFYSGFDRSMLLKMQELCSLADIITPNFTEAMLLCNRTTDSLSDEKQAAIEAARQSAELFGVKTVIVTGVKQEGQIVNVGYHAKAKEWFFQTDPQIGTACYSGTGDLLASALCGCMIRGESAQSALKKAVIFLESALKQTVSEGCDPNEGILFEPYLHLLMDFQQRNRPAVLTGEGGIFQ